jgi:hypothetical protein
MAASEVSILHPEEQSQSPKPKCVICGRSDYTSRTSNQKTCGREECKEELRVQLSKEWQKSHRVELNERFRKNYERKKLKIRLSELERFRANPNEELETCIIAEYIVCRECGAKLRSLNLHLRLHGLTTDQYSSKYPGAPLSSSSHGRALSQSLLGKVHRVKGKADKWEILELRALHNRPVSEIVKQLHRDETTIFWTLRRTGLMYGSGGNVSPCYSFGEVMDRAAIRHFFEISGLSLKEFAQYAGLPMSTAEKHLGGGPGRPIFDTARKVAEWRKCIFQYLMAIAPGAGNWKGKYPQNRVLRTFFPNLRKRHALLVDVLKCLRKILNEHLDWSSKDLREYLIRQTTLEKAGRANGSLFSRFLPWAPELMPSLGSNLHLIRNSSHKFLPSKLLAGSLCTTVPVIQSVLNRIQARAIKPIPRSEMAWLVRNYALTVVSSNHRKQPSVKAQQRNLGGRPKGMSEETREDAKLLLQHVTEFENQHGRKEGALAFASLKVYGAVNERKRIERARKTIIRYRKELGTKT